MSMLILVLSLFFFFNDTATTEIYTLSLHDALPISYNITTGFDNNGDTVPNDRPPGLWRNAARGPGTTNVDARLSKRWGLQKREHAPTIEWAIDAFNVLNQVNFKTYVGTMTSPFFGRANAALAARQLQLSLRFNF